MAIPWGAIISAGGQVASSYAANKAKGREAEAVLNQAQDRNQLAGYQTDKAADLSALAQQYQALLDRAKGQLEEYQTELAAPKARAGNAVLGDVLAGVQDVSIDHPRANVVHVAGGLRPSLLSGDTRELGAQMSRQALLDQMTGTPTPFSATTAPDFSSITSRKAPAVTELPQESAIDKIIAGIGTAGSAAAAINAAMQQQQQQPTTAGTLATAGGMRPTAGLPTTVGTTVPGMTPPYAPTPTRNPWI